MKEEFSIKRKTLIITAILSVALIAGIIIWSSFSGSKEEVANNGIDTSNSKEIQGVIEEDNLYNYLIESGGKKVEVPKSNKSNTSLELEIGDEVKVFYDGKMSNRTPAQISEVVTIELIKKADSSKGEEKKKGSEDDSPVSGDSKESNVKNPGEDSSADSGSLKKEKTKYYNLPILSISSKEASRMLANNESALVYDLMDNLKWDDKKDELNPDYVFKVGNELIFEFDSKKGVVRDVRKEKTTKIQIELSKLLKKTIDGNI